MNVLHDRSVLDQESLDEQHWREMERFNTVAATKLKRQMEPSRDHHETPAAPDPRWDALKGVKV